MIKPIIATCDKCSYEEECRDKPPCILDAYYQGIDECIEFIRGNCDMQDLYLPIHIIEMLQEMRAQK